MCETHLKTAPASQNRFSGISFTVPFFKRLWSYHFSIQWIPTSRWGPHIVIEYNILDFLIFFIYFRLFRHLESSMRGTWNPQWILESDQQNDRKSRYFMDFPDLKLFLNFERRFLCEHLVSGDCRTLYHYVKCVQKFNDYLVEKSLSFHKFSTVFGNSRSFGNFRWSRVRRNSNEQKILKTDEISPSKPFYFSNNQNRFLRKC